MKWNLFSVILAITVSIYFSGCTTMGRGMDYAVNSVGGIDFPKKTGKIYIESTTKEDTKNITPNNAQLNGFDNVVIKDIEEQCDVVPELTDVLTEHGWKITKNKEEADYQIYTSVVYCGAGGRWIEGSSREIPIKERFYYEQLVHEMKNEGVKGTPEDIANQNEKVLAQLAPSFDVKRFKNYFNVYDYRYEDAPDNVIELLHTIDKDGKDNMQANNHLTSHGIISSTNAISAGNTKTGIAMIGLSLLMGLDGHQLSEYSVSKIEFKIYASANNVTKKEYFSITDRMNEGYDRYYTNNSNRFNSTKQHIDQFAIGRFYK